jgi:predicted nucleotidyltransferase
MIELFDKYASWKILKHFALEPSEQIYVNKLAKKLNLSVGICSKILREFQTFGILEKKELGQAHYYKLRDNYFTKELKRFVGMFQIYNIKLIKKILKQKPEIISIALYGSYAKGEFDEESDIDIIILTPNKFNIDLSDLEEEIELDINIKEFTIGEWLKMKNENNSFYNEVLNTHILLFGSELP